MTSSTAPPSNLIGQDYKAVGICNTDILSYGNTTRMEGGVIVAKPRIITPRGSYTG